MEEQRLSRYRERVAGIAQSCGEPTLTLLQDLLRELEGLSGENKRLRNALVKASQQSGGMSSKLKDALYE